MNVPPQDLFGAIAEPNRRLILERLRECDLSAGEIGSGFALTQPTVSKHLSVLRRTGLVSVRIQAQQRWYHLEPERLRELDSWLDPYRQLWDERLDALGTYLDTMPDE